MQKTNRTDRILIILTLLLILGASGLFYFDSWMWGNRRDRGEKIGFVAVRSGDVRVKFEGDLKFQRAPNGQELIYNDSIYAGANGSAKLQLGESEMTVAENSLIVLRRQNNTDFMNLAYGNLFGKIAKNEKIIIDTGDGHPVELTAKSDTQIIIKKNKNGATTFDVVSGEAQMLRAGELAALTKSTRVTVKPDAAPKFENVSLQIVKPLHTQIVYSEDPSKIDFEWRWENNRTPTPSDQYKIEFSIDPTFSSIHARREVEGSLTTSMNTNESVNYHFRIKGPHDSVSSSEQVNFVRMRKPVILLPSENQQFLTPDGMNGVVDLSFRRPENASVIYEVAMDPEFKNVFSTDHLSELKGIKELPVGQYFIRAKSDYGMGHHTSWTDTVPFTVDPKLEMLPLTQTDAQHKVMIANRAYPKNLYTADASVIREYLAKKGLLRDFFKGDFDKLELDFADGNPLTLTPGNRSWPKEKMNPGAYTYKYQASKQGFKTSGWSEDKNLEITMEPPKPVGDVHYGDIDKDGNSEAKWKFTPILFAKSYDVEVAKTPSMQNPEELHVTKTEVKTKLNGDSYWRVRARDAQGRIISEFSRAYKNQAAVPQFLAKNPPAAAKPKEQRDPAAVESSNVAKVERHYEEPFKGNGWWGWLGIGENYVDYRESIPAVGTAQDHRFAGPSQFVETGFVSNNNGWGGVVSYKSTPGKINLENAVLDHNNYNWTTMGLEGILRKRAPFSIFGNPVIYGMRLGIQQHRMPFVFIDGFSTPYLKSITMNNVSAGVLAEWYHRRWTYYWLMRYQVPVLSSADGASAFSAKPVFAFDGSVGAAYNLTRQLKAGIFWYGQWHQFQYSYSDGDIVDAGNQSMFYSNMDFRLGWDF